MTGRTCINASADGRNLVYGRRSSCIFPLTPTIRYRQHHCACPSAQRRRPKKAGEDQAIGRSRGGLSTKIHALVDALGNPVNFFLTGGEAHDLVGADHLLPSMQADTLIATKRSMPTSGSSRRWRAGKTAVIPPKANRRLPRDYDQYIYQARHLIENFFAKLKQFRAIATRYDKTARNFLAAIHLTAGLIWLNEKALAHTLSELSLLCPLRSCIVVMHGDVICLSAVNGCQFMIVAISSGSYRLTAAAATNALSSRL